MSTISVYNPLRITMGASISSLPYRSFLSAPNFTDSLTRNKWVTFVSAVAWNGCSSYVRVHVGIRLAGSQNHQNVLCLLAERYLAGTNAQRDGAPSDPRQPFTTALCAILISDFQLCHRSAQLLCV